MLRGMNLIGGGATVSVEGSYTFNSQAGLVQVPHTVMTTASLSMGVAAADRKIVVVCNGVISNSGVTLSTLTIGGVSLAHDVSVGTTALTSLRTEIWSKDIASGTTGVVVATWSGNTNQSQCFVYSLYGFATGDAATSDTGTDPASDSDVLSLDIDVAAKGFVLASMVRADTVDREWTNVVEDDYQQPSDGHAVASKIYSTAQNALTITGESSQAANAAMAAAAWPLA